MSVGLGQPQLALFDARVDLAFATRTSQSRSSWYSFTQTLIAARASTVRVLSDSCTVRVIVDELV